MKRFYRTANHREGFTIVELLIVVVVIAILAAVIVVSFNGITTQAKESGLKSDLSNAAKQLHLAKVESGSFPGNTSGVKKSGDTALQYDSTANTFCRTATSADLPGKAFHIRESGSVQSGACSGHTVGGGGGSTEIAANAPIQSVTSAQCAALPTFNGSNVAAVRTVTDNRGGTTRTYEIAKPADGKCWMLTNLKLGSTSGSITLTPSDSDVASSFVLPSFTPFEVPDFSWQAGTYIDNPHSYGPVPGDTGSGAANYGYLYNFSAATAGATRVSLPMNGGDAPYSICPAGWRLPSSGFNNPSDYAPLPTNDFVNLDIAFGGTGDWAGDGEPSIAKWRSTGVFKSSYASWWSGGVVEWWSL